VQISQTPTATLHALKKGETAGAIIGGVLGAGALGVVIAWLAGGFDREKFSDDELVEYLTLLATTRRTAGHTESDNKARNVVSRWNAPNKFDVDKGFSTGKVSLTANELKRLLIQEMILGPTGESDQLAIITIFRRSEPADVKALLDPTLGVSLQDIETELSKENLSTLLSVLNQKLPDLGKPQVKRSETAQKGECTVGRAIKISFAHQRAVVVVDQTIRLLDQFISNPAGNKIVKAQLDCYFNNPTKEQITRIRSDFQEMSAVLTKITYTCPAEPFKEFAVSGPGGRKVYKPEKDLYMRAPVDLAEGEGRTFQNMVFPDFFEIDPGEQASGCIHESFHHAKKQGEDVPEKYKPGCGALRRRLR
jgi:hypothetical protein